MSFGSFETKLADFESFVQNLLQNFGRKSKNESQIFRKLFELSKALHRFKSWFGSLS
jgi:hypothetical protein